MVKPGRLCYVLPPCENRVGKFFGAGRFLPSTHHLIGCGGECPYLTRIRGNINCCSKSIMSETERKCWIGPVQLCLSLLNFEELSFFVFTSLCWGTFMVETMVRCSRPVSHTGTQVSRSTHSTFLFVMNIQSSQSTSEKVKLLWFWRYEKKVLQLFIHVDKCLMLVLLQY